MTDPRPARVAVLVSGSGTLLQALLDASAAGAPFTVCAVVSDREGVGGLDRARAAQVPTAVVRLADFPTRELWDRGLAEAVAVFSPDLVVSAGFMKICGPHFLDRFGAVSINTHPALLPSFPGAHGVRDALAHGVKVTGCSVFLLDAGVDTGPIVAQEAVPVLDGDTEEVLHERVKQVERRLVVDVVTAMTSRGWRLEGRHVRLGTAPDA